MKTLEIKKWFKSGLTRYYFNDENGNSIGFIQDKELNNGGGITTMNGEISYEFLNIIIPECVRVGSDKFVDSVDFFKLDQIVKSKTLIEIK